MQILQSVDETRVEKDGELIVIKQTTIDGDIHPIVFHKDYAKKIAEMILEASNTC